MPLCCSLSQFFFFHLLRRNKIGLKVDESAGELFAGAHLAKQGNRKRKESEREREREREREIQEIQQNTNVRASFSFCNVNAPVSFDPRSIPFRVLCAPYRENPIRFGCRVVCPCLLKFHNGSRDREIKERGASQYVRNPMTESNERNDHLAYLRQLR